jgi:hypothetical protein
MTRINLFRTQSSRNQANCNSVTWGKTNLAESYLGATVSALVFAGLLLACSLTVGCTTEQAKNDPPKPVTPTSQNPVTQSAATVPASAPLSPTSPAPQTAAKPVHRKVVHKAPPTSTYADKATGVTFQYPRSYALKTGASANELISADPMPMDFTHPGGAPLAAVLLPESVYPDSDLSSADFSVSVNKTLTAEQCNEFSVPQPNPATPANPAVQATAQLSTPPVSKLLIGDMELVSSNTNSIETDKGARQESAKYYHVFQNGACYEFALKVATAGDDSKQIDGATRHVDRTEVFQRLEKILATVKINPVQAEVSAEATTNPQPAENPAQ